jgi:hypothetical protein
MLLRSRCRALLFESLSNTHSSDVGMCRALQEDLRRQLVQLSHVYVCVASTELLARPVMS